MQLQPDLGPDVLMTIQMVEKDLLQWLALLLVGVLAPFATASFLLYKRAIEEHTVGFEIEYDVDESCVGSELTLGKGMLAASWMLFKTLIGGGDGLVDCLQESAQPVAGVILMETYLVLSVILLVNLLIALMSKTFDLVYENKDSNYMYLFARLVISCDDQPLLPPPLNMLQFVGHLVAVVSSC
eukprot:6867224-Prymnesium_polylepis.1